MRMPPMRRPTYPSWLGVDEAEEKRALLDRILRSALPWRRQFSPSTQALSQSLDDLARVACDAEIIVIPPHRCDMLGAVQEGAMRIAYRLFIFGLAITTLAGIIVTTQDSFDVKAHYDKQEVMIPMRDGVKLFTIVYTPKDKAGRYPILLTRTAYGIPPYGPNEYRSVIGPNNDFAREGYIVAYQDARGRFKSEGEFIHHVPYIKGSKKSNEVTDTWDTIDWLVKNVAGNNGRVGQWGISWGGWQVSMGMIEAHPALKASSPQAPPQDQFQGDDHHSGGAFQLMYAFSWMSSNARARNAPTTEGTRRFDYGTPDGYQFFRELGAAVNARQFFENQVPTWNDYMTHGTYDEYWQARNVPKDLENITHPVLIVASWFDAQDFYGPFRMYRAIEEKNRPNKTTLVVGPWTHGGWSRSDGESIGPVRFGSKTGVFFRQEVELPFFNYYLKDKGTLNLPEALVFETGANRWQRHEQWPPQGTSPHKLYLQASGGLALDKVPPRMAESFDAYMSDPEKPVPYSAVVTTIEGHEFMVEDQRFAATRPDVLVFQSPRLTEDLTIAGPIDAVLYVSTTGTDGDWVAKLIDVLLPDEPDPQPNPYNVRMGGYQMLVAGDILRAKFRNSLSKPEPMVPNQVTKLEFSLGDKYHTFKKGHRVMVQIQSSWFPMFDRNPQTFVDIYHAQRSDYRRATHKLFRSAEYASHLAVPVLADATRRTSRQP
jgi:putative CocE/NonD family hydrolase